LPARARLRSRKGACYEHDRRGDARSEPSRSAPEYDLPEHVPEWRWIQQNASFDYRDNAVDPGAWEFIVRLREECEQEFQNSIPPALKPFFQYAAERGATCICFYQL
jgi:hypothetical protein